MADLEKLDKVITELEVQSRDLKEFNIVYLEIGKLKQDIEDNLNILKDNNEHLTSVSDELESKLTKSKEQIEKLENVLVKKIQELYQDNKNFQKELDSSLFSRLDKHRSDIQVDLRNEGVQTQRAFQTSLQTHFNSLESKLKEAFLEQAKQLNLLKTLIYIGIGLTMGLAVAIFLK